VAIARIVKQIPYLIPIGQRRVTPSCIASSAPIDAVLLESIVAKTIDTKNKASEKNTPASFAEKNRDRLKGRTNATEAVPEESSRPIVLNAAEEANTIPNTKSADNPHSCGKRVGSPN
jgi:hypothetical protein